MDPADRIADELYGLPPHRFTAARDGHVKAARAAGDKALAAAIGTLRRPSVSAWLVNLLVRRRPDDVIALLELGGRLHQAQSKLAAEDLRRLSADRHRIVGALVREGARLAEEHGRPFGGPVEQEIAATLEAGLADPAAAQAIRAGRLSVGMHYSGFGPGPEGTAAPAVAPPTRSRAAADATRPAAERPTAQRPAAKRPAADAERVNAERAAAQHALAGARAHLSDAEVAEREREQTARRAEVVVGELEGQLASARIAARAADKALDRARDATRQARRVAQEAERRLSPTKHKDDCRP